MKILFRTNDLIAGNLAYILTKEGHDVRLLIDEKGRRGNLDGLVKKVTNWRSALNWVGKDGLIVFDDVGYGKMQDSLRNKGYNVFGGTELGDKLENDREYGYNIFKKYGIKTVKLKDFDNMDEAVLFIKKHPGPWVIKQNNHAPKTLNYTSQFDDGRDAVSVLKNYLQNKYINNERITLQERIVGVEIGVGRYFNGNDWVGPMEINIEHKRFLVGDLGPTTSEMGTLAWYDDNEDNRLFQETLAKLKPFLKKIKFKGDMEINCIVNENGAFPLEATSRFGSPIVHLHSEIHNSPWGEFLYSIANGKSHNLQWKKGFGIVVAITVPPFPYAKKEKHNIAYGMKIFFDKLSPEEWKHVHFEEVSKRIHGNENEYYISDNRGYVVYVTGMGDTVERARKNTYDIIEKIVIPKMVYRNDIGSRFIEESEMKLKKWGYL